MTALTLLSRSIRNSEGRITRFDDLEIDQFDIKIRINRKMQIRKLKYVI